VALSVVSLDGVRFCGLAVGFFCLFDLRGAERIGICSPGWDWNRRHASFNGIRFIALPALRRLRYWHSGPEFLPDALRHPAGDFVLVYAWCRWGLARRIQSAHPAGKTSLLVYWVHIEFVYGRSPSCKRPVQSTESHGRLIVIFLAMLALSLLRTSWKKRTRQRFTVGFCGSC